MYNIDISKRTLSFMKFQIKKIYLYLWPYYLLNNKYCELTLFWINAHVLLFTRPFLVSFGIWNKIYASLTHLF